MTPFVPFNLRRTILISAILRLALIVYGEWQDSHMVVRYTDIDYSVFSDAADLVLKGSSPFERSTYRYSPLLAFLLVPNSLIHRSWGKFLFSSADLLVGFFVDAILQLRGVPENLRLRAFQAAFWYGLIVHFRVYPIIYSLPLVLVINKANVGLSGKPALQQWDSRLNKLTTGPVRKPSVWSLLMSCITKERILFGLLSGSVFFFWTSLFFYLYGWEFVNEALLYHLTRTDPRHNFSIYFYHIYLHHQHGFSVLEKLISFLPQMMVQLALVFQFFEDIPLCFFAQTVAFVAFNKVITAQYFVWFFCLLPLILPWSSMKLKWKGLLCVLVWMGSQVHWLMWAYLLEFKGQNVFLQLWVASLVFLASNTWVLLMVIKHHRYSPIFKPLTSSPDARKLK